MITFCAVSACLERSRESIEFRRREHIHIKFEGFFSRENFDGEKSLKCFQRACHAVDLFITECNLVKFSFAASNQSQGEDFCASCTL